MRPLSQQSSAAKGKNRSFVYNHLITLLLFRLDPKSLSESNNGTKLLTITKTAKIRTKYICKLNKYIKLSSLITHWLILRKVLKHLSITIWIIMRKQINNKNQQIYFSCLQYVEINENYFPRESLNISNWESNNELKHYQNFRLCCPKIHVVLRHHNFFLDIACSRKGRL